MDIPDDLFPDFPSLSDENVNPKTKAILEAVMAMDSLNTDLHLCKGHKVMEACERLPRTVLFNVKKMGALDEVW